MGEKIPNEDEDEKRHTGYSVNEVNGISESAEVDKSPIKGKLAVGTMIDGHNDVTASPPLASLSPEFRRGHHRNQRRQLHFSPSVLFYVFLHRFHLSLSLSVLLVVATPGFVIGQPPLNFRVAVVYGGNVNDPRILKTFSGKFNYFGKRNLILITVKI